MSIDAAIDQALDAQDEQDDTRRLPPRPATHPVSGPCEHDQLLAAVSRIGRRGAAAAERAAKELTACRKIVAGEQDKRRAAAEDSARKAQLRDKLARLEREMRETKALLRKPITGTGTPPVAISADLDESRRARVWARENGVECPWRGRVPGHVIDAYRSAHPTTERNPS